MFFMFLIGQKYLKLKEWKINSGPVPCEFTCQLFPGWRFDHHSSRPIAFSGPISTVFQILWCLTEKSSDDAFEDFRMDFSPFQIPLLFSFAIIFLYLEVIFINIYYWIKRTPPCTAHVNTTQLDNYWETPGGPAAINCRCPMAADSHMQK